MMHVGILAQGNKKGDAIFLDLLRVQFEIAINTGIELQSIVGIENGKRIAITQYPNLFLKNSISQGMKGGKDHSSQGLAPHHFLKSMLHFAGALIGKGNRHNAGRCNSLVQHVLDSMGNHSGLAATRSSKNEQGALDMMYRICLVGI